MDRTSFYFLYVNANSIVELALQLLAEQMLAQPAPPDQLTPMTSEEIHARVAESFADLDLAAIENGTFDLSRLPSGAEADQMPAAEALPSQEVSAEAAAARESSIERYLADSYSHEDELRPRLDRYYQQADMPALEAALGQLPLDLPPLTQALSPQDMSRWVLLYESRNAALGEVVVQVRQWAMSDDEEVE